VLSALLSGHLPAAEQPVHDYDDPPQPLKITRPIYPTQALSKGVQGTVLVDFTVDADGRVRDARVVQSAPGLDKAALDCVRKWRFMPARKDGRPAAVAAQAPVIFSIPSAKETP
jgi:protein TonB